MVEADEETFSIGNLNCKVDPYTKDLPLWNVCNTPIAICSNKNVVYERVCTVTDGSGWPPSNDGRMCSGTILTNLLEVEKHPPLKYQLEMVLYETSPATPCNIAQ